MKEMLVFHHSVQNFETRAAIISVCWYLNSPFKFHQARRTNVTWPAKFLESKWMEQRGPERPPDPGGLKEPLSTFIQLLRLTSCNADRSDSDNYGFKAAFSISRVRKWRGFYFAGVRHLRGLLRSFI